MNEANARAAKAAIEKAGDTTAVAKRLNVKPNVVTNWKARGIPERYAERVAKLAKLPVAEVLPYCNTCGSRLV